MGTYLDLDGHATWVDDRGGSGETVLLLHGGLSNGDDLMDRLGPALTDQYRLISFDRRGHGRTADRDEPFTYVAMADETIALLERLGVPKAHLVGWSDGAIVAMLVARTRPDLVDRTVLIGANYHVEGILSLDIAPDSPVAQEIYQSYVERSPDGADHFGAVMDKAFTLFATEPTMTLEDVAAITAPTLVMAGDDDMITLAHTCALYEALPHGQLAIVPGTSHALPMEKAALTAQLVLDFLAAAVPPATMMPVRRKDPTSS